MTSPPAPAAMNMIRILHVEDNRLDQELVHDALTAAGGFSIDAVSTIDEFQRRLSEPQFDCIVSDLHLIGFDGLRVLELAREKVPQIPLIFMTGTGSEVLAVEAMKQGAADYIIKKASHIIRLPGAIRAALDKQRIKATMERAERALRVSEAGYRTLFDANPHPMWLYDLQSLAFLAVNDSAVAHYGYAREEFLSMTIADIRPAEDVPRLLKNISTVGLGTNRAQHWVHRKKDGVLITVEISANDVLWGGRAARLVLAHDVTAWLRAQDQLRTLSRAVEQSPASIIITNRSGAIEYVNPKFVELTGYALEDVLGKNPRLLRSGQTPVQEYTRLWQTILNAGVWRGELCNRKKSGELYWELAAISGIVDDTGAVAHFVSVQEDITERKRAADALARSEAYYRSLIANSSDVISVMGANAIARYHSPSIERVLGYAPGELIGHSVLDGVHPQDLSKVAAPLLRLLSSHGQGVAVGFRFRHKDGSWRHLEAIGTGVSDLDGQAVVILNSRDVTERTVQQDKIARLSRIRAVLSGINSLIVRVHARQELFDEACRIAVEHGNFGIAWIGVLDPVTLDITPVAEAGSDTQRLGTAQLSARADGPLGQSVLSRALRECRAVFSNDLAADPSGGGERIREAIRRDYRSMVALPLAVEGKVVGNLSLFAKGTDFFDADELKLLNELAADISFALDHIAKEEQVNYAAFYDALTGLPNRNLFSERLNQSLQQARHDGKMQALVLVDVERFRNINDTLGRPGGDALLKSVAQRLKQAVGETGILARIESNHFALIVGTIEEAADAAHFVMQTINACFYLPFQWQETELRLSARFGIAVFPGDGGDADTLLKNADVALDKAKLVTERFLFYAPDMNARVAETLRLENRLRNAAQQGQFVLHYQPKLSATTGAIVGVEALMRWNDPETGLVPPLKFIPILEETGLILTVGEWALNQAVRDYRKWHDMGLAAPRVAVNVSAIQLRQDDFVAVVRKAIDSAASDDHGLDIEITESLIMTDVENNVTKLKAIRDMGVGIGIDDFGTGYSSLSYIAKLPVNTLKIDRSFVIRMTKTAEDAGIVSAIVSLAHQLKMKVVAEGVEELEQADFLRARQCDELQGYLFSRPVPAGHIEAMLRQA